jgi:hypothetical protein
MSGRRQKTYNYKLPMTKAQKAIQEGQVWVIGYFIIEACLFFGICYLVLKR